MKICPICFKEIDMKWLEKHVLQHIDASYETEHLAFQETQRMRQLYKKLFKKET